MNNFLKLAIVGVTILGLAGCAGKDRVANTAIGYVTNVENLAAAADWKKAEVVTVTLSEYAISPPNLTLKSGMPYRLKIENKGDNDHLFVSEEFFKAVASKALLGKFGENRYPLLKAIVVASGETRELQFVAVRKGVYPLECSLPFHAGFGMKGNITIQ